MHKPYIRIVPGADTAVLMVHGIVGTPRHFDFLLDAIDESISVVNILLPGHGGTVRDFGSTSMRQWKAEVDANMAELCRTHKRVIVVGHSMGTLLTAEAAKNYPNAEGFLFLNVPLRVWVAPHMPLTALRWSFGKQRPGNPLDAGLKAAASIQPDRHLWRYLSWIPRFWELLALCRQSRARFETFDRPAFAFQSYDDELVRRSASRHLLKNPNIRHILLQGCGHFFYPPEIHTQMREALKSLLDGKKP